jgi:hypothetical protein
MIRRARQVALRDAIELAEDALKLGMTLEGFIEAQRSVLDVEERIAKEQGLE